MAPGTENGTVYPVPIRSGMEAMLHLPNDLTKAEAEKICRVVMALAKEADESR